MFAGRLNPLQIPDNGGFSQFLGFLLEHFTIANDRIERRPQFMAHVGEKNALGAVRVFGGLFCIEQFFLGSFVLGDIPHEAAEYPLVRELNR